MKSASATILAGDFFFLSEIEFREILHINKILLCAYVCSLIWFAIKLILFPASCTFLFSAFFSLSLSLVFLLFITNHRAKRGKKWNDIQDEKRLDLCRKSFVPSKTSTFPNYPKYKSLVSHSYRTLDKYFSFTFGIIVIERASALSFPFSHMLCSSVVIYITLVPLRDENCR